jgi:hypothetical protein
MALRNRADASAAARHLKSCPGVYFGRSMTTVGELLSLRPKSLKYKHLVSSVPSPSRSTRAEKNSISRGDFGLLAAKAVNSAVTKSAPYLANSKGAARPENRSNQGSWRRAWDSNTRYACMPTKRPAPSVISEAMTELA